LVTAWGIIYENFYLYFDDLNNFNVIKFSAHVSGYAGKRIKGLGRISGLDPAG
jgi:hypothetical protein